MIKVMKWASAKKLILYPTTFSNNQRREQVKSVFLLMVIGRDEKLLFVSDTSLQRLLSVC